MSLETRLERAREYRKHLGSCGGEIYCWQDLVAFADAECAALEARVDELEHTIWHALDDSADGEVKDGIVIQQSDFDRLARLVPEDHPTRKGNAVTTEEVLAGVELELQAVTADLAQRDAALAAMRATLETVKKYWPNTLGTVEPALAIDAGRDFLDAFEAGRVALRDLLADSDRWLADGAIAALKGTRTQLAHDAARDALARMDRVTGKARRET